MNEYERMRLSEAQDDDAVEPDEIPAADPKFAENYEDFYDDVKLRNNTKQDW